MALVCATALSACAFPLQFEEQADAGLDTDYPPVIGTVTPASPGPLTITDTPTAIHVDVSDKDLDDTMFVRVFRNYTMSAPTAPVLTKKVAPSGTRSRSVDTTTQGWCQGDPGGTQVVFEMVVADREFLDSDVEPFFRALPMGAESSSVFWLGTCPTL